MYLAAKLRAMSSTTIMILTMASVFIGACCFGGGYAAKSYGKSTKAVVSWIIGAFFFVLLVPLIFAVFMATGFIGDAAMN